MTGNYIEYVYAAYAFAGLLLCGITITSILRHAALKKKERAAHD